MKHHHDVRSLKRLSSIAAATDIPHERLRKARQRNPETFPTVWIDGEAFHQTDPVVRFMSTTSRGRPRTSTT